MNLQRIACTLTMPTSLWKLLYEYTAVLQYRATNQGFYDPSRNSVVGGVLMKWLVDHQKEIEVEYADTVLAIESYAAKYGLPQSIRRGRYSGKGSLRTKRAQYAHVQWTIRKVVAWERTTSLLRPSGLPRKVWLRALRDGAAYSDQKRAVLQFADGATKLLGPGRVALLLLERTLAAEDAARASRAKRR